MRYRAQGAGLVVHKARGQERYELVIGGVVVCRGTLEAAERFVDGAWRNLAPKLGREPPPLLVLEWWKEPTPA